MEIDIYGRNLNVNPKLRAYVERKMEKLDRYMPDIQEVRVDLAVENSRSDPEHTQIAQVTLRHSRGTILRAEERTSDLYASVDGVVDKLYRQIEKYKGRRRR
ncbi:MAG: ribosome-associated translation inhibitor RaiA [Chloroflexi bacterium]|nr:ribosome-associated translation inhibitor RaiA [Chloroflexota bacterium]